MRCASAEFLSALQRFVIRLFSSRTFYEGDVVDYTAASFFTTGTCPTPAAKTAAISGSYPEGVAIDAFGNLYVSFSDANALSIYQGPL